MKPTRIEIAIENMKSRLKKMDMDLMCLTKQRETLQNEIWALEKIKDDKSFDE